jgi:mRNA-degrading endonuclease RelE of RelBE toxin-antitoxin system
LAELNIDRQVKKKLKELAELNIDHQIKKELKELAAFQDKDPYINTLRDQVTSQTAKVQDGQYAIQEGVIHFKNHKSYPFWKPMLPSSLENGVIKMCTYFLGSCRK